jgi:hypothetical protein
MKRPEVNLDGVARVLDAALDHPATAIAGQYFPETVARMRQIRENLPELASGVEARALQSLEDEAKGLARDLERELLGGLGKFIDATLRKHGRAPPKRLKAPKRKKAKR